MLSEWEIYCFKTKKTEAGGKERKNYYQDQFIAPCDAKSLPEAEGKILVR